MPRAPCSVTRSSANGAGQTALRIEWKAALGGAPIRHYGARQVLPDSTYRFLTGSPGIAAYVPALRRTGSEAATSLEVRAIGETFTASEPVSLSYQW
ncbi:GH85 family endohexosaminidase C-terminal domain-containing protein [Streptomyces zagrosensis]|uniref:Endo-beta-N-acetylglucosaminidase D-like D2 domain-containing protein n=1 Tax=Streptomyces zagrosensis TaxID=1042984 RepID=A0A7W9UZX3_9ACTN|nr:hypothetical protein [Streptomyces zagrosensis]MBB5937518.1 hypothetical protein [Streptomyces zagrosensis]